jgi:enediyne biosynthesis protein E4
VGQDRPWLGLRLVGGEPPRDQLGARAALYRKGAPPLVREARTDGSYASAGDPRVLFGLGRAAGGAAAGHEVEKLRVRWPSGRVEEWTGLPTLTYTTLREGTGEPVAP